MVGCHAEFSSASQNRQILKQVQDDRLVLLQIQKQVQDDIVAARRKKNWKIKITFQSVGYVMIYLIRKDYV